MYWKMAWRTLSVAAGMLLMKAYTMVEWSEEIQPYVNLIAIMSVFGWLAVTYLMDKWRNKIIEWYKKQESKRT